MAMSKSEYEDTPEMRKSPEHQRNANRKRILIVEDDYRSMTLLNDFLQAHGYEILKASEGAEAVNLARHEQPDLILMDIRLPNISGLDATRLLKNDDQTKKIPIIAVTAFATPGDQTTALESGCAAYILKPVNVYELLKTVGSFLSASPPTVDNPQ
jgi:two-component system, cell cycle response regulator DivK